MAEQIRASCAEEGASNVKFHVVERSGYRSRWEAVCGTQTLMSQDTVPAHAISPQARCRKSLCQRRFFGADQDAAGGQEVPRG
jgi:hypothetical protein